MIPALDLYQEFLLDFTDRLSLYFITTMASVLMRAFLTNGQLFDAQAQPATDLFQEIDELDDAVRLAGC